jgi:hypothetical protein
MRVGRLLLVEGTPFDWIVLVLALGVLGVLVVEALRRPNRQRLALRVALSGVAVAALVLMAWQPRWQTPRASAEALLLTPGAQPARVARLADSLTTARLYALPDAPPVAGLDVERTPDVGFLARTYPEVGTLHVVGDGLPDYALDALRGVQIRAYPSPPRSGISFVDAPRTLTVGQTLRVQGQVVIEDERNSDASYVLYLDGPGGPVDSAVVVVPGATVFSLEDAPRQAGRYLYHFVLVTTPGDTLAAEPLGLSVRDPAPLCVLVVQGAPRFETRHLKNWLAGEGGQLAIRSTISRDRYRTEFLNLPERDLSRITPAVLRAFDVAILDERALAAMAASERRALQASVEEEGFGVLLSPDLLTLNDAPSRGFFHPFDLQPLDDAGQRRVRLRWENTVLSSSIPAEPYSIAPEWGVDLLMQDESGHAVAAMRIAGLGRVGFSLATETYRWVLEGNAAMHAAYWSHLLSALARPSNGADQWAVGTRGPVFRDEPVTLVLHTAGESPRGVVFSPASPDTVYLVQDPIEPTRWRGTFWPRTTGWHRFATARAASSDETGLWFYVHDPATWIVLQAAKKTTATKHFAEKSASILLEAERTGPLASVPVPMWWWFIPFVASCAGLWLESKL